MSSESIVDGFSSDRVEVDCKKKTNAFSGGSPRRDASHFIMCLEACVDSAFHFPIESNAIRPSWYREFAVSDGTTLEQLIIDNSANSELGRRSSLRV